MTEKSDSKEQQQSEQPGRLIKAKHFIIIVLICIVVPVAAAGWTDLYKHYLEHSPPVIDLLDVPRGIGAAPVSFKFKVSDADSGLDEIVVRSRQKGVVRELKRVELKGKASEEMVLDFNGDASGFDEGLATIEIRAFDRSFWSNGNELSVPFHVDYRKPKIEVLSTQHNARQGGSQLIFYKAFDENLAVSGVKLENKTFLGFPVGALDKDITDKNIYATIYAVPQGADPNNLSIKLFAEDAVGNGASATFYNKVAPRSSREVKLSITEEFLREKISALAEDGHARIVVAKTDETEKNEIHKGSIEWLLQEFTFVNEKVRSYNENQLLSLVMKNSRNEAFFDSPFVRQPANAQVSFADTLIYNYEGKEIGRANSNGEDLLMPRDQSEVIASHEGIVAFSQELGTYGWAIGIDHGMGVMSIYGHLKGTLVKQGDSVNKGQSIGLVGSSGFSRNTSLYFEIRIQGVPVDPKEWWEPSWFYSHIVGKTNDLKKALGIPVYIPLH